MPVTSTGGSVCTVITWPLNSRHIAGVFTVTSSVGIESKNLKVRRWFPCSFPIPFCDFAFFESIGCTEKFHSLVRIKLLHAHILLGISFGKKKCKNFKVLTFQSC